MDKTLQIKSRFAFIVQKLIKSFCVFTVSAGFFIYPLFGFSYELNQDVFSKESYFLASASSKKLSGVGFNKLDTMSKKQYIAGGVLGTVVGFGAGHAIQGRWLDRGWIFTAVEIPLIVIMQQLIVAGFVASKNSSGS